MRWDMNEVIVEIARSGGGYDKGAGRRNKHRPNDSDDEPIHESMFGRHRGYDRKSQGDKLNPLRRFLERFIDGFWYRTWTEKIGPFRYTNPVTLVVKEYFEEKPHKFQCGKKELKQIREWLRRSMERTVAF